jgi:hypothetical protein
MKTAKILHSFYIRIQPVQEEFVATSDISDIYELGETPAQASLNYLHSLVDELIWFQDNKDSLSESMLEDFNKLQRYLEI